MMKHARKWKAYLGSIYLLLLLLITGCGATELQTMSSTNGQNTEETAEVSDTLKVHYLDVGQGDCTLIESQGEYMLIDAGDNDKGTLVQSYLESQNITHLKYMIGTHPDSDHIGGMDVVLTKFDVDTVIMPDIENDTRTYDDVIQAMKYKNIQNTSPIPGQQYRLGEASFTIIAPVHYDYGSNTNNYSVGLILQHGNHRFLFTGDTEIEAQKDILESGVDISADVYKAAHHGSATAAYEPFLQAVNPKYTVISCGEDNSYGHPHAEVLNWMRQNHVEIFRTDEQGTIVATSDGSTISWNMSSSETWHNGEPTQSDKEVLNTTQEYVLNLKTKKFHRTDCPSVETIHEENKEVSHKTRDALIKEGYDACGRCNP